MQPAPEGKDAALNAIPVLSSALRLQFTEQGLVRITYPATLRPWLARLLPRRTSLPMRTLELDSMGSFVWKYIDGSNTVQHLAEIVAQQYKCHPSEARQAVATFIRQLGQRGILGLR